jgi:hypothetical protein
MNTPAEAVNRSNGHDELGRFTKSNQGGPGNPFAGRVAALRAILVNAVTADDMQAIALALIEKAKEGNLQAIKMLFSYTIGKPQVIPIMDDSEPAIAPAPSSAAPAYSKEDEAALELLMQALSAAEKNDRSAARSALGHPPASGKRAAPPSDPSPNGVLHDADGTRQTSGNGPSTNGKNRSH